MDGKNRIVLLEGELLGWPNGLAIGKLITYMLSCSNKLFT